MAKNRHIENLRQKRDHLEEIATQHRDKAEAAKQIDYIKYRKAATCSETRLLLEKAESIEKKLRDTERELEEAIRYEKCAGNDLLETLIDTNWEEQINNQNVNKDRGNTTTLTPQQILHRDELERRFQPQIDFCIKALLSLPKVAQSEQGQRILNGLRTPGSVIYADALKWSIQKLIRQLQNNIYFYHQDTQQFITYLKNHPPLTYNTIQNNADTDIHTETEPDAVAQAKTGNNVLHTLLEHVKQEDNTVVDTLLEAFGEKDE